MKLWIWTNTLIRLRVKGDGVLKEPGGHCIMTHVEMEKTHIVGNHRVITLAIFTEMDRQN